LHPLSWMKTTLAQGTLDGRLTCPNARCGANIGKFAWQGLRCSCGGWVTPGFAVGRAKIDEVSVGKRGGGQSGGAGAIRLPVRGGKDRGHGSGGGTMDSSASGGPAVPSAVRLPPGIRRVGGGNL
jgi:dual specificity phosphatase 12